MHPALTIVPIALMAFGVGFATQRGSICGLLAARQFAETGRTSRLAAFVTASLWALVLAVPLCWLTGNAAVLSPSFEVSGAAILGGALYGLGTFINGGCVFGTVARIASGNLSFLTALPGIALGAGFGTVSVLPRLSFVSVDSPLSQPGIAPLAVLIVAFGFACLALAGIARAHRRAGLRIRQVLRASRWRTSLAMMIIGVLGGLLFATGTPWSYPALLKQLGNSIWGKEVMFALPVIVGPVALFAGAITAGAAGGRFALRPFVGVQLARSLAGGAVMGFATILIPGGNDSLLLSALPSLAMHGAVAYFAMLGVQIFLCTLSTRLKQRNS